MGILTNSVITREEFYKNFDYYYNWFKQFSIVEIKVNDWLIEILKELEQIKDNSICDEFNRLAYEKFMSIVIPKHMNEGFTYNEAELLASTHLDVDEMKVYDVYKYLTEEQKQKVLDVFFN